MKSIVNNIWKEEANALVSILSEKKSPCRGNVILDSGKLTVKNVEVTYEIKQWRKVVLNDNVSLNFSICIKLNNEKYANNSMMFVGPVFGYDPFYHINGEHKKYSEETKDLFYYYVKPKRKGQKRKYSYFKGFNISDFVKEYLKAFNKNLNQEKFRSPIPLYVMFKVSEKDYLLCTTLSLDHLKKASYNVLTFIGRDNSKVIKIDITASQLNKLYSSRNNLSFSFNQDLAYQMFIELYSPINNTQLDVTDFYKDSAFLKNVFLETKSIIGSKNNPEESNIIRSLLKPYLDDNILSYYIKPILEINTNSQSKLEDLLIVQQLKQIEIYSDVFGEKAKISCNSVNKLEIEKILNKNNIKKINIQFSIDENYDKVSVVYIKQ